MKSLLLVVGLVLSLGATMQKPVPLTYAQISALTKNYATWYSYIYNEVPLARQFKPLGTNGKLITRKYFLQQLLTGKVLAFSIGQKRHPIYQLYPYEGKDVQLRTVSQRLAQDALYQTDRVGQPLPAFHFTDLQGKTYTPEALRGKVLVFKCWFIHCVGCVKEFPEVNALVDKYKIYNDVIFISLAYDDAPALRKFLLQKPLQYAVVPNMRNYMDKVLKVNGYPTHVIVGRDGQIVYMTNTAAYVDYAIKAAL